MAKDFANSAKNLPIERPQRFGFGLLLILLIGSIFRIYGLEMKPVHFDEGINGHFVQTMWRDGFYHYDPTNFHGPLYFYILMVTERLFGIGIFGFRFVTGLIGVAVVLVIGLHRRFVGQTALYAALIVALSPAFVFYSRYAIHESLFILSQVAFSYGFFRYREDKSALSIWWITLAVVGLATTKETFVIFLGTWGLAAIGLRVFEALRTPEDLASHDLAQPPLDANETAHNWFAISFVGLLLILALFTGFFLYMRGAIDMITAFKFWARTGTAHTGHEKPFIYWIDLLRSYEWPCLIGLAATPFLFLSKNRTLRMISLVGFGTWLAYSLIPYKTPWLILNFLWLLAFAAGALIARVIPIWPHWRCLRTGLAAGTTALVFISAGRMWRLNFRDFSKPSEPYVYVQSTDDFKHAIDILLNHIQRVPEDIGIRVVAMNRDPWPLPYLLETLSNVSWSSGPLGAHGEPLDLKNADVILIDGEDRETIAKQIKGTYAVLPFQIRDAYQSGDAYFKVDTFKAEMAGVTRVTFAGEKP